MSAAVEHHGAGFQRWRGRQVDVALRQKDRAELAALRAQIRDARAARRTRVRAAMQACREARLAVKAKAARAREKLRAYIARAKAEAKGQCSSSREHEREAGTRTIASAAAARDALRADIRLRRRAEGARLRERLSKREARGESDDEVRGNIPRELAPVWERVKSRIHAGPRRSRTEAFLEWVHDNSASVEHYLNEAVEGDVEELVRQEAAHYANPGSKAARYRAATRAVLTLSRRIDSGGNTARNRHAWADALHRWQQAKRGVPPATRAAIDHELGRYSAARNPRRNPPLGSFRKVAFGELAVGRVYTNEYGQGIYRKLDAQTALNTSSMQPHRVHPRHIVYTSPELEVAYSMRNPTKKRRNPYVAGSTVEGELVPGTFRWNRRGIGNPGRPTSTHGRRLAFFANMAKGALRKGDRAAALEWRRKFLAERKNPAPVRRAPPGNPDRFASRRTGWAALADARPAAGAAAARAMRLNPHQRNSEGMTWLEWLRATGWAGRAVDGTRRLQLRVAWERGEDPTEHHVSLARRNPLTRGFSRKSIAKNIKREQRRGVKRGQAVAIALNVARKAAKKKLGHLPKYLRKRNPTGWAKRKRQLLRAEAALLREMSRFVRIGDRAARAGDDATLAKARAAEGALRKQAFRIRAELAALHTKNPLVRGGKKKNPRVRPRKTARRRSSVRWWRATIYGPGGKVVHRQVARANPAQARASVAALAKRHGRVALDGPFATKPAC